MSNKLEELLEARDDQYDQSTQEIFEEIPHVVEGIKDYLYLINIEPNSVKFETLDVLDNVVYISLYCKSQPTAENADKSLHNSMTVKVPGELVFSGSKELIVKYLKDSNIVHVDEDGEMLDIEIPLDSKKQRILH